MHYSAARILAQAADHAKPVPRSRKPSGSTDIQVYQDRALMLLGQAVERTPPEARAAFWRDVVRSDRVFASLRRLPAYARIAAAGDVSQPR